MEKKRRNSADSDLIVQLVGTLGSLSVAQIEEVLKGGHTEPKKIINHLVESRFVKLYPSGEYTPDAYIIPFKDSDPNFRAVNCFWVILDLLSDIEGNIDRKSYETMMTGRGVVDAMYVQNDAFLIELLYVEPNKTSNIIAVKQRVFEYTKDGNKDQVVYMFVTRSEKIVREIKEMKLTFPHKIALLSGEIGEKPQIEYF